MLDKPQETLNEVWRVIPSSSQARALDTRCHHTLYTGSRGPGKTDTQLMRFFKRVGLGYGQFWRGIIFDKEYKNLDDLVAKSKRWFPRYDNPGRFLESKADYKWVWPTGEELMFRSARVKADYWNFHGQEYPFIGWNELCKYATAELYNMMMSCNRSSFTSKDWPLDGKGVPIELPPIPLEVFSTTNSYGPGHGWVKRRFIDPAPYGDVVRVVSHVFNPQTQKDEDVVRTQVAIFGSYRENIYLSPEYVAELDSTVDENMRRAWLKGDWNIVAGGAIDDVWSQSVIVPRFNIPAGWRIDRAMDWGSSHPFYIGWYAEANGEEAILPDGTAFCPPAHSIVLLHEWYGTKDIGSNVGIKISATEMAHGVQSREIELLQYQYIAVQPLPGPADNQIRDVREVDVDTIEKKMADEGVRWTHSDKSAGSRRNGLQLFRDMLAATKGNKEKPRFYAMEHCRAFISTVPFLPRDDDAIDDVDTTAEDHPYDATRYRVLAGSSRAAKSIKASITF